MIVKIKREHTNITIPSYKTKGSSGCDVCASEFVVIPTDSCVAVKTGIFLEIPEGYECQVRPRSGLALKNCVTVLNSHGTIDCDFRGEVQVLLYNAGKSPFTVNVGDRIAQLVFAPVVQAIFETTEELNVTDRGNNGFGSTGVK